MDVTGGGVRPEYERAIADRGRAYGAGRAERGGLGASLFASNIGSEHIVGLSGQGASTGMAMAHWELHAWVMIMLAWVFVPFYYRSRVFTMPEFLERRFNSTARWMLSVVSLIAYVFTKVSVTVVLRRK